MATTQSKMRKNHINASLTLFLVLAFFSCTTYKQSMKEPNTKINLDKSDFTLTDQVTSEATSIKILGIDFPRLFIKKTGTLVGSAADINMATIPVIGSFVSDNTSNYALYELMNANPGYDVVFYPQFNTKILKPFLGIGLITKITTVKTTARLGRLNK